MWRDLLRRLAARRADAPVPLVDDDPWASVGRASRPDSALLARIERTALDVYARHGLPTAHGHYRRGRRARAWTFLGEHLSPEARWAMLLERPPEQGWRYGTLADIGRSGEPEVRAASALLADCALLRMATIHGGGTDPMETLEAAVRLGADWRSLESGRLKIGNTRLRLTAPVDDPDAAPASPGEARPAPAGPRKARRKG